MEKTLSLDALEFLRRFLLHVLPRGFVRIRHFGLLANCHATDQIATCRRWLEVAPAALLLPNPPVDYRTLYHQLTGRSLDLCPVCQQGHLVRHDLPSAGLPTSNRSPPAVIPAPAPAVGTS